MDFYGAEELGVHGALKKLTLPGLIRWDGPRRSLGSKGPAQRLYFVGFFDANHITDLTMKARSVVRDIDPMNDMTFFRVRSRRKEILVAPDKHLFLICIQETDHEQQ